MTIFSRIASIPPAPRKFLLFSMLNLVSWQCIVGSVLVLFGRSIQMPPSWIGVMLSFLPLSMILVFFSIPAVEKFGPRKLMLTTWLLRNLAATLVFLIPVALRWWRQDTAWYILMFAILSFSIIRAVGVGAWYPWLHELVPRENLGTYFALESIWVQLLTVLVTLVVARILGWGQGLQRFYWVYGVGITAGLISVWYATRIPGGNRRLTVSAKRRRFMALQDAVADLHYRRFILTVILSMSSLMWVSVASVLYLRDVLLLRDQRIMIYMAAGALAVAGFVQFSFKAIDRRRNHTIMALFMGIQVITAFAWFALNPVSASTPLLAAMLVVLGAVINAGFVMVATKAMMGLVPQEECVGHTTLWMAGLSVANGIPPILAGWLIDLFRFDGYRACFLLSAAGGLIVAVLWYRFPMDDVALPDDIHLFIRPQQPLRTLQRITWMLLGIRKKEP